MVDFELPESSSFAYLEKLAPYRVLMLRYMVRKYKPKFVIFYSVSSTYIEYWSKISGVNFINVVPVVLAESSKGQNYYAKIKMSKKHLYAISFHPAL